LPQNQEKSDLLEKKDDQSQHKPEDPHTLPQNPEKSDLLEKKDNQPRLNKPEDPRAFTVSKKGQNGTCPNMPKQITTRCRRRDDAIFDDATTSITTRCL
jgi:hypothetical protein